MIAEGSGSLFGAEVPRIEHEHEYDWESEGRNALVIKGGTPVLQSPFCPEQNAGLHFLLNILEIAGITIAKNRRDERVSASVACNEIPFVSGAFNISQ